MMEALEFSLTSLREAQIRELRDNHNRKVRTSNLALCTATSYEASLPVRLEAAQRALDVWQGDSIMTQEVARQIPDLVAILRAKGTA